MTSGQVRTLAAYNRWMNEKLYAVAAELSDQERKQDRGAFFRSIHGTLNHGLLGDKIWMSRFTGQPFSAPGLDHELHADFEALRADRASMDGAIEQWAVEIADSTLAGVLAFTSMVDPAPRRFDYWLAVTHFFNHQTHHRGQLTTLLSQCGKDYGVTDLIWLPGVQR